MLYFNESMHNAVRLETSQLFILVNPNQFMTTKETEDVL